MSTNPDSLKAIFERIQSKLPAELRPFCYFGLRALAQHASPKRIVFVPGRDSFTAQGRKAGTTNPKQNPEQLFTRNAGLDLYIEAQTHDEIEGRGGLLDLVISAFYPEMQGSFAIEGGGFTPAPDQATRGELYVLNLVIARPVCKAEHTTEEVLTAEIEQDVI